ncbi:hypothetical protein [Chitinophaga pinensis]|nr:hypothetical protein [Chitinophaga pinensis]
MNQWLHEVAHHYIYENTYRKRFIKPGLDILFNGDVRPDAVQPL